jgi:thiamine transporter ThiT
LSWYHWIAAYMIIIPIFLIAIVPGGWWSGWIFTGFILSVVGAIVIIKFAPYPENDMPKEYYDKRNKEG